MSDCNLTDTSFDCGDCKSYEKEIKLLKIREGKLMDLVVDFAYNGTRHDPNPTCMTLPSGEFGPPRTNGFAGYVFEMDKYVRDRATKLLQELGPRK